MAGVTKQVQSFAGGAVGSGDFASRAIALAGFSDSTDIHIPIGRRSKTIPAKSHKSKITLFAECAVDTVITISVESATQ